MYIVFTRKIQRFFLVSSFIESGGRKKTHNFSNMVKFEIEGSIFPDNPLEDKFLLCRSNGY